MTKTHLIAVMAILIAAGSAFGEYSGGTGEPNTPYQIANKDDLLALAANTGDYGKCFILTADIDMQGQVFSTAIIAAGDFTGTFDGNYHKITNFTINGENNLGLFYQISSGGSVKNLGIENCSVAGDNSHYLGSLVGYNYYGTISNCYSTGSVTGGDNSYGLGGLVGATYGGSISNCYSTGSVSGGSNSDEVGGLAGDNFNGSITNCYSTGTVSGSSYVGGLAGDNSGTINNCHSTSTVTVSGYGVVGGLVGENDGTISNCYSTGSVSGGSNSDEVGGLAGDNFNGSITNCYSTGTVSGSSTVGGLTGYNSGIINSCYSTGQVSGSSTVGGLMGYNEGSTNNCCSTGGVNGSTGVGGLVGYNSWWGTINNCYSTGQVSGSSTVGGLVGRYDGSGIVSSFWDIQTSGQTTSSGGTGKTTAEMKTLSTFTSAGWDFVNETINGTCNYWQMSADTYPVLSFFNGYIPPKPAGSGTPQTPYIIADANDLGTIWYRPFANYILANDINLAGIGWSMAVVPAFNGVLDGKGFCIKNLSVNGGRYLGLFGLIGAGGLVENLGIKNCTLSSFGPTSCVGGLVGANEDGIINNCYSTGAVSGSGYVGGLVGWNIGSISNCYSTDQVSSSLGSWVAGGLTGCNSGIINSCYSTGQVSGSYDVGGLVGESRGSVLDSFWDINTSGQTTSAGGTGMTTAEMKTLSTFTSAGWDFTTIWAICWGTNYPRLKWELVPPTITPAMPASDPSAGLKPSGNVLSGHLNYWDVAQNQWVPMTSVPIECTPDFDPALPTIVIAPGWHDGIPTDGSAHWSATIAQKLKTIANNHVNVLAWNWPEGENPTGASDAIHDVILTGLTGADSSAGYGAFVAGPRLASEFEQLNLNPSQTQLIGHSNGGAVAGSAASAILKATGMKVERLTTLDTPNLTQGDIPYAPLLDGIQWIISTYQSNKNTSVHATKYINPDAVQETEVYYSSDRAKLGFGTTVLGGNVFNGDIYPPCGAYPDEHRNTHDWYTNLGDINNRAIAGINWSIVSPNRPLTWPAGSFAEQGANTGVFGPTSIHDQVAVMYSSTVTFNFQTGDTWSGIHVTPVIDAYGIHMQLSGDSDGYLFKTITIPADATVMTFDMKVVTVVSGDYITLSFGDKVLFYEDITGVDSNFVTTLPIPIPDLAGQTDTLLFTLHHDTDTPGSSILLDNITFSATRSVADLDMDGDVDFVDFTIFANHWMYQNCAEPDWCEGTDFDHSGSVDIFDLAEFAKYWLSGF